MQKKVKKRLFSAYITEEIYDLMDFLTDREEITKVVFVRRSLQYFLDSGQRVDPRVRIRERKDPDYIKRNRLIMTYIEEDLWQGMKQAAEDQHCNLSQVFFSAVVNYCAVLIEQDSTGIDL